MITFMPMIGFFKSLRELDDARLERQRRDAHDILATLLTPRPMEHPAVWMWQGFEYTLGVYGMSACSEWQNARGHRDRICFEIFDLLEGLPHELGTPPWMGDLNIHRSHRSYLIRRNPNQYALKWPKTPENMPILWPQLIGMDNYRLRISVKERTLLERGERILPAWLEYDQSRNEVIDLEEK